MFLHEEPVHAGSPTTARATKSRGVPHRTRNSLEQARGYAEVDDSRLCIPGQVPLLPQPPVAEALDGGLGLWLWFRPSTRRRAPLPPLL